MRLLICLTALAAVLSAPRAADAATMRYLDIEALTDASDAIVRGRVVDARVYRGSYDRITTEWTVRVAYGWKNAPETELRVRQWAGELDGVVERIPGDARIAIGDEIVVFARGNEQDGFTFTALAQSVYQVQDAAPLLPPSLEPGDLVPGPLGWDQLAGEGARAGRDLRGVVLYDENEARAVLREGSAEVLPLAELERAIDDAVRTGGDR